MAASALWEQGFVVVAGTVWPAKLTLFPTQPFTESLLTPALMYEAQWQFFSFFFKKDFSYLFLERGKGREKERETSIGFSHMLPNREPNL